MTADAHPGHRRTSLAAAGLQLWVFVFVAFAGTTLLWTQPVLRLTALALFALPVLAWAIARVRGPMELLDVAILFGIAVHLVVSLFSLDPEGSLEASAIVVVYAGVYWLARHVATDPVLRRVTVIAVVMALAFWLIVIGLTWVAEKVVDARAFGWPPRLDAYQPYVWGSINTPPVLLLLAVPFVSWLPRGGFRTAIALTLVLVALVVIPFSVGRAAWLGIAVAIVGLGFLFGVPILRRAVGARAPLVAVAAIGVVGLVAALPLIDRLDAVAAALDSRVRLWQQAAGLFGADPVTGAGPTTFAWARLVHVPDFTDRVGATAAHNVPMQTLAEGGLLLGAATLFILVAWAWQVAAPRGILGSGQRVALAVLAGFAAFSLFDDFSFLPAVTVLVIILAAWVLPPRREPVPVARFGARALVLPAALAVAAVLTVPTAVSMGIMRVDLAAARAAAVEGDWRSALTGFQSAARVQPANSLHWMSIGLAQYRLGQEPSAMIAYETAVAVSPGDPRPWGALAALSVGDERIRLLLEGARRSNDPQYAYRLASALMAEGERETAADYFAVAAIIHPPLYAAVPDEMRSRTRAEIGNAIARVGSIGGADPNEAAWNTALDVDEVHGDAPIQWRVARHVDAGDEAAALAALQEAVETHPRSVRTWQAASAAARLTCDRTAYEDAEAMLDLVGRESVAADHRVAERRPRLYREPELGDYQPLNEPSLPNVPQWPLGLIEVPDCGW